MFYVISLNESSERDKISGTFDLNQSTRPVQGCTGSALHLQKHLPLKTCFDELTLCLKY